MVFHSEETTYEWFKSVLRVTFSID